MPFHLLEYNTNEVVLVLSVETLANIARAFKLLPRTLIDMKMSWNFFVFVRDAMSVCFGFVPRKHWKTRELELQFLEIISTKHGEFTRFFLCVRA